jgi:hypothetical protein
LRYLALLIAVCAISIGVSSARAANLRLEIVGVTETPGKLRLAVASVGPDGKPIPGLAGADFKASLNGTPVDVKDVQLARPAGMPASAMIVVDGSKAIAGAPLAQERLAVQDFVNGLEPGDRIGILSYAARLDLLQDISPDRPPLAAPLGRITGSGDPDLYNAVSDASRRIGQQPAGRRIVLLLTAGKPIGAADLRVASIAAAKNSGAVFYIVGFGDFDRTYANDLTSATGGRLLEVVAPTGLRGAFSDLALAVRSQYVISGDVPPSVDRTTPGKLNVQMVRGTDIVSVDKALDPLPGAVTPTFTLKLDGIVSGQRIATPVSFIPAVDKDVSLAKAEYSVDGNVVQTVTQTPFSLAFDPGSLAPGNHILKIVATDTGGRTGSLQVPFVSAKPAAAGKSGGTSPVTILMVLLLLLIGGGLVFRIIKKRRAGADPNRTRAWSGRVPVTVRGSRDSQAFQAEREDPEERLQGRLIVMDTRKNGQGGSVRQFELRGMPLTFGTAQQCNIRVEDPTGEIGSEEARIWVQKRRLVYHKLTTLSAMATEGMVSGWVFLDDGEELHIGPYRLVYRAEASFVPDEAEETVQDMSLPA